jgi:hypothetical protein
MSMTLGFLWGHSEPYLNISCQFIGMFSDKILQMGHAIIKSCLLL